MLQSWVRYCLFLVVFGAFALVLILSAGELYAQAAANKEIASCRGSESCFGALIDGEISEHGLDAGFKLLREIYVREPQFRGNCNVFAMTLANDTFGRLPRVSRSMITPALVTCNYGFLQQYPVDLLLAMRDTAGAKTFCVDVAAAIGAAVPGAESECYRGVGRGLPLISGVRNGDQEAIASYALAQCRILAPNENDYETCVSGLFNKIGRSSISGSSGLSLDTSDPMALCEVQTDPDARSRCFGNYKATVISMVDVYDPAQAQRNIMQLYGPGASSTAADALWTIGYEWARTRLVAGGPFSSAIAACASLSEPFVHDCIQGASVGLAKHGIPGEQHVLLTAFCKTARQVLPELSPQDCPSLQAVGYLRGFYSPADFAVALAFMRTGLGEVALPPPGAYGY